MQFKTPQSSFPTEAVVPWKANCVWSSPISSVWAAWIEFWLLLSWWPLLNWPYSWPYWQLRTSKKKLKSMKPSTPAVSVRKAKSRRLFAPVSKCLLVKMRILHLCPIKMMLACWGLHLKKCTVLFPGKHVASWQSTSFNSHFKVLVRFHYWIPLELLDCCLKLKMDFYVLIFNLLSHGVKRSNATYRSHTYKKKSYLSFFCSNLFQKAFWIISKLKWKQKTLPGYRYFNNKVKKTVYNCFFLTAIFHLLCWEMICWQIRVALFPGV